MNGGSAGDLISVKYDEKLNQVAFYWSLNEDLASIDFLKQSAEDVRNQLRLLFQENSARQMLKDIIRAEASLNIVYKSPSSGKTAQFLLSLEDLKDIQNAPLMSDQERLQMILSNQIKMENKRCPYKIDEGMRMTKVDLVNDNVVYYCELDEAFCDINQLKIAEAEVVKEIKNYIKEGLKNDPSLQRQIKMMIELGIGLQYRYYGNKSQQTYDVIMSSQELHNMLPKILR